MTEGARSTIRLTLWCGRLLREWRRHPRRAALHSIQGLAEVSPLEQAMKPPVWEDATPSSFGDLVRPTRRDVLALAALGLASGAPGMAFAAGSQGQLTWGVHISLAPTWFDPAETPGIITPFLVLYALHDAMLKPLPGNMATPCLAESFTAAEDALVYEFVLRDGAKFHNGEPV